MIAPSRKRQQELRRRESAAEKDVAIPWPEDLRRRRRHERNDVAWLRYYFSVESGCVDPFWYEFTYQQVEMIEAIRHAIEYGGDQAIAASRGEGKTTIFERLLSKYVLEGRVRFAVLFAATGTAAANSLEAIKNAIETNAFLLADYPEVCAPVVALQNTPQRAHFQTVTGRRLDNRRVFRESPSKFSWTGQQISLPNVPGAPAARAVIATRGLDAAVRGLKMGGMRPEVAGIDDPDTEETARSGEQAKKLEDRIDKAIGGLGGQQHPIARVMLTTLQNRICTSYRFTDPAEKPSWKGRRFRYLVKPPERTDLWEEYINLRQSALAAYAEGTGKDQFGREAHKFFVANRAAMEEGAEVANPNRFDGSILPDGSAAEISALQRYYNEVARIGPEAVSTEYDNDPPEEMGPVESEISAYRVTRQLGGFPRFVVPSSCKVVVQGVDVGKRQLHWVVRAWTPEAIGYVIDYGVTDVLGTVVGTDDGLDVALYRAICERADEMLARPYVSADGGTVPVELTLVDCGYRTDAIHRACAAAGRSWKPAMGIGQSSGCVRGNFFEVARRTRDKIPGDGWYKSKKTAGWFVGMDTDRWKAWEHDRWMTTPGRPGSLQLFGEPSDARRLTPDEKQHYRYAHHIVNEKEVEEIVRGVLKRYWKVVGTQSGNHYLDASYMTNVAANMLGIRLVDLRLPKATVDREARARRIREMAQ